MRKVLVPLADGFEELEAICIIDILRRAKLNVTVAGIKKGIIVGRSNIGVQPDTDLDAVLNDAFDLVVLPGGMPASSTLRDDSRVLQTLQTVNDNDGYVAAICAAPIALNAAGLLKDKQFTCYPGMETQLPEEGFLDADVVTCGNMITSQGPGTAVEFSLELIRVLLGDDVACDIAEQLVA